MYIPGIHLNINSDKITYKSGQMVNLVASPHRPDYGLNVTYQWLNKTKKVVGTGKELVFDSIRVS